MTERRDDALEQVARAAMTPFEMAGARHRDAEWLAMDPNERGELWTREMLAEMYFMACYDRRGLLREYDRLIAAVREADALREALRDAAMSYHTVKEHSRKFSECDWASCRMWRAALSATEPVEGAK